MLCLLSAMVCVMTGRYTLPTSATLRGKVREGQQSLSQAHVIEITPERRLAARRSNELGHVPNSAGEDARRSISTISKRLRF